MFRSRFEATVAKSQGRECPVPVSVNLKPWFTAALMRARSGTIAPTCTVAHYLWRALKRELLLQITNTLPRRRTTLQSRCRCFADFRDESTFTADSSIEVRPGSACHGWRALWLLLIFAFRDERMDIGLKQAGKCSASKGLRQA